MSRLHFFGWLMIGFCVVLMGLILWSRPAANFQFLRDSGLPRISYDSGSIELRYFPIEKQRQLKNEIDSELSVRGFTASKDVKGHAQYTDGDETVTLIPKENLSNPRLEVVYRRQANLLEMVFHGFWDY